MSAGGIEEKERGQKGVAPGAVRLAAFRRTPEGADENGSGQKNSVEGSKRTGFNKNEICTDI